MSDLTTSIFDIPQEITEHALVHAEPRDVASFAQTCRTARALVYDQRDQHLWRRLFLEQPYDDPRRSAAIAFHSDSDSDSGSIDWKRALQQRVYAMRIVQKIANHPTDLATALSALISVARHAPPMPEQPDESKDLIWLNNLVRENNVFGLTAPEHKWSFEEHQRIAELWTYIGWRDSVINRNGAELLDVRNQARTFVYDMRKYARENSWGPFIPDKSGSINWTHIEAVITVIYCNLMDLNDLWPDTRPPARLDAVRAYSSPKSHQRDPRDWAGVEGAWRRYVCFMDYRDLFTVFRYVCQYSANAYDPAFFEDDEFQEATRLIELNLTITGIGEKKSAAGSVSRMSTFSPDSSPSAPSPQFPVIFFVGRSRGGNGNESKVRGSVRMTPDGHIRWRFTPKASIYDGHSQWSSEGIQIGGVCSAAGVVGTWTGAHHEEGPFWLWKVGDDHPSHLHN
ncbi:hypothetical protein ACEPAI_992 [Sanghuangporus weigelae]